MRMDPFYPSPTPFADLQRCKLATGAGVPYRVPPLTSMTLLVVKLDARLHM